MEKVGNMENTSQLFIKIASNSFSNPGQTMKFRRRKQATLVTYFQNEVKLTPNKNVLIINGILNSNIHLEIIQELAKLQ